MILYILRTDRFPQYTLPFRFGDERGRTQAHFIG
jgi:hypothetical protein